MEELIKNIILNSESDTGFIGDAIEIGNVVFDLIEDGVEFDCTIEELDEMIDNNDILQLTKVVCEDCGKVSYLVEEVFDEDGETIPDELETLYIDSDLLDCVDLEAFGDTEIVVVELEFEDEECNGDCEEEDLGFVLTQELLDTLSEIDSNDVESIVDIIADKLNEAFEMGYQEGVDNSLAELHETVKAIECLRNVD